MDKISAGKNMDRDSSDHLASMVTADNGLLKPYFVYADEKWLGRHSVEVKRVIKAVFGAKIFSLEISRETSKTEYDLEGLKRAILSSPIGAGMQVLDGTLVLTGEDGARFERGNEFFQVDALPPALRRYIGAQIRLWAQVFESKTSGKSPTLSIILAELPDSERDLKTVSLETIPEIGKMLFPSHAGKLPLPSPLHVTPRLIVIKGLAGTGKTTLAVHLMTALAKGRVKCDYWCTNDNAEAIRHTATSFGCCGRGGIEAWEKPIHGKYREQVITIRNAFVDYEQALESEPSRKARGQGGRCGAFPIS